MIYEIPEGGLCKETEGVFTQIFDKDGQLVDSGFWADTSAVSLVDEHGDTIRPWDNRTNYYHKFDTAHPKTVAVLKELLNGNKSFTVIKDAHDIINHLSL